MKEESLLKIAKILEELADAIKASIGDAQTKEGIKKPPISPPPGSPQG
jgi:hypothetical protein